MIVARASPGNNDRLVLEYKNNMMVGELLTVKNPQQKHQAIANALEARNVWKLRELALASGGLLNGKLFNTGFLDSYIDYLCVLN